MSATDTADRVAAAATDLAEELRDDGVAALPRREVNRRVGDRGEFAAVPHEAVKRGFEDAGWAYDRHLYLDPDVVEQRASELAVDCADEGRVVVTREEAVDAVAPEAERGDEAGWQKGQFVGLLRRSFEAEGWTVERVDRGGRERTLFMLPLGDLLERHHPNGRPPLSTDDLLRLYVARSLEESV